MCEVEGGVAKQTQLLWKHFHPAPASFPFLLMLVVAKSLSPVNLVSGGEARAFIFLCIVSAGHRALAQSKESAKDKSVAERKRRTRQRERGKGGRGEEVTASLSQSGSNLLPVIRGQVERRREF